MAIPSNDAVLAALKGAPAATPKVALPSHAEIVSNLGSSYSALPKPQMTNLVPISQTFEGNTGTMGKKTFADYTPAIQNASAEVQKGIERLQLYDTEGNIIPKKPDISFAPSSMPGSTPAVAEKAPGALAFFGEVLDRISGGIVSPMTGDNLEKVNGITVPKKFTDIAMAGAKGAFGEKAGAPIGIALGIIGDPLNLLTGPTGAVGKLKLINDLRDAKNAAEAANVLRAAKVPEDLIPGYAEKFGVMTDKTQIGQGVDHLIQTLETTKQTMQAEEGATRALKTIAAQQKEVPAGVAANAEKIATQLGIKKPETFYHGANAQTAEKIKATGFRGSVTSPGYGMVSLTPDAKIAEGYTAVPEHVGETAVKGEVFAVKLKPDLKVKTYDSMGAYMKAMEATGEKTSAEMEAKANEGYDMIKINDLVLVKPSAIDYGVKRILKNPLPIGVEENIGAQTAQEAEILQGANNNPDLKTLAADAAKYKTPEEFVSETIFNKSLSGAEMKAIESYKGETTADKLTSLYNEVKGEEAATRTTLTTSETARVSILEERAAALTDEAATAENASEKATILQQLKLTTDELDALKAKVESFEKTGIEQAQAAVKEFENKVKGEKIPNPEKEIALGDNVSITRQAIKHIVEQRGAQASSLIKDIPKVLSEPTKIADNSAKRADSFLFARMNGNARATVLEVTKRPDGSHQIVSAFPIDAKTYKKLVDITGRPDVPPLHISAVESVLSTARRIPKEGTTVSIGTQALGETKKTPVTTPNLVKNIAIEKRPHAITEMLKDNFPKMSEKTLDVFGQRMAQYTRASDIEGLLSSLQRLSTQADATGQRILEATLSDSVRLALTPKEAQMNVELLTRQIKTPENSAIAEAEYSALWEHADQRVIDRFNEANVEKGILEEVIDAHPGKFFTQFRLPGQAYEDMDLAESLAKGLKTGGKNKNIDTFLAEQGYADLTEAQKGMEDYLALRAHLKDLQSEIRELKPQVRSAQVVRGMLDELPVVPNRRIGTIDEMANTADIRSTYKDISGFSGGFRDMYRNFEHFFGSRFGDIKEAILDPFDEAKGKYVDLYNKFGDDVKENIVDKFGFKRGSEESKAIQDWGERSLMTRPETANPDSVYHTEEALVAKFGEQKARDIKKAANWFRQEYDKVIDEINDVRKKIYPNNPSKLISKRKDYFRHYQEFGSSVMDAVRNFMDVPSGIEPKLVGISEFTKPKSKFLSLAQLRKGPISERDAIGGFLDYAPAASYAINIDPQIGVFRYLRRKLAEKAPLAGSTENQAVQPGIDNFLQFLDDFSNNLATKTNPVDRWIQKRIPGGRATMKAMDWINSRVKANTILGNLGSSFAQMANIPQGIASAKQYSIQGAARTLASILEPNTAMKESTFLKERYLTNLKERFPRDFWSKPIKASTEKAARVAAEFLKIGDQIGTHFIWNSHYAKGVAEGMKNPVKYADDITRKLVAGRGIGELPIDQQAKITQMLAPFTVEVQNFWWILQDQIKAKDFTGLAALLVANYLFNQVSEKTRGSRVVYDPVNALVEGAASLQREASKGNLARGGMEFTGRQIGEVASNVPFGQDITALLPDTLFGMKKTDIFGQGDPNRFGPPVLLAGAIKNPLWRVAPPFAGAQLQKTYNGIVGLMQGQATSASGKTNFPIASTPGNIVRSLIFGPNSTSEAQASFATGDELHQRLATQDVINKQAATDAEQKWTELKALKASGGDVAAEWAQIGKDNPQLLARLKQIGKDEALGLTTNDRLVSMLNVGNGERASYIADQINSLKTKEEKQALWKEYVTKKLLTPDVQKQVTPLIEGTNAALTK